MSSYTIGCWSSWSTPCRRSLGHAGGAGGRGVESSRRLGRHRWKVERSLAWLLATGA
jgi:hypothetical protein